MLAEIESPDLQSDAQKAILKALLVKAPDAAWELAMAWLRSAREQPERAISAALALLATRPDRAWQDLFAVVCEDPKWGRSLVEALTSGFERSLGSDLLTALGDKELGELLTWLWNEYPPEEDPKDTGDEQDRFGIRWGVIPPQLRVAWWRGEALDRLSQGSTPAALHALEGLLASHPDQPWLHFTVRKAREMLGERLWRPLSASGVNEMLLDPRSRTT